MSGQIILSCPFCHHRAEYQDAPPGSTVRCHECSSIFRVPAISHRKPGTVVKGEQIRTGGKGKLVAWIVLGVGGWCGWQKWMKPEAPVTDRWAHVKDIWPEETAEGMLQRFLLSWKEEKLEWLMDYARPSDQPKPGDTEFAEWLQSMFGNITLASYEITGVKKVNAYLEIYRINLLGADLTGVEQKGSMSPKVVLEKTAEGEAKWGVDVRSAVPRWE